MSVSQNQVVDYIKNLKLGESEEFAWAMSQAFGITMGGTPVEVLKYVERYLHLEAEWEARVWRAHIQAEKLRREAQYYDDDDYEGIPD